VQEIIEDLSEEEDKSVFWTVAERLDKNRAKDDDSFGPIKNMGVFLKELAQAKIESKDKEERLWDVQSYYKVREELETKGINKNDPEYAKEFVMRFTRLSNQKYEEWLEGIVFNIGGINEVGGLLPGTRQKVLQTMRLDASRGR
jgi:hypothetical protein